MSMSGGYHLIGGSISIVCLFLGSHDHLRVQVEAFKLSDEMALL